MKIDHTISEIGTGCCVVGKAGQPQPLGNPTQIKKVDIQAEFTNAGVILVGGKNLDDNSGIALRPGATYSLEIDDISKVYIDAAYTGEGVRYVYFR